MLSVDDPEEEKVFSRKQIVEERVVIELSDETKQALTSIDNDIQTLVALQNEVIANQRTVIAQLSAEITAQIPTTSGVNPFEEKSKEWRKQTRGGVKDSPFRRRPRHETVDWLVNDIMANGLWHTPILVADTHSSTPEERRYLRRTIQRVMSELVDEGMLEQRKSAVKGAMFDYRKLSK